MKFWLDNAFYPLKLYYYYFIAEPIWSVDVTFEGHETTGYFLKPAPPDSLAEDQDGAQVNVDKFTLLKNTSPGGSTTIKAQYGPFSARQTIPSTGLFNFVTDRVPSLEQNSSSEAQETSHSSGFSEKLFQASSDISAHLVVNELRRDNPVLKVLFHTASAISSSHSSRSQSGNYKFYPHDSCVTLLVHLIDSFDTLNTTCSPSENASGTCLAEIVIPAIWWPPMDDPSPKSLKRMARVEYFVHPKNMHEPCNRPDAQPPKNHLANLPLSTSHGSYEEIRNDDFVSIMVPQTPIYPRSKVYVPVFLQPNPTYPIYVFVIR